MVWGKGCFWVRLQNRLWLALLRSNPYRVFVYSRIFFTTNMLPRWGLTSHIKDVSIIMSQLRCLRWISIFQLVTICNQLTFFFFETATICSHFMFCIFSQSNKGVEFTRLKLVYCCLMHQIQFFYSLLTTGYFFFYLRSSVKSVGKNQQHTRVAGRDAYVTFYLV